MCISVIEDKPTTNNNEGCRQQPFESEGILGWISLLKKYLKISKQYFIWGTLWLWEINPNMYINNSNRGMNDCHFTEFGMIIK